MRFIFRFHYIVWIPFVYLVLYVISHLPLAWGHRVLFPETPYALLIFLPAGLRLIATWYFGARAIGPLFLGGLITLWWYGHPVPSVALTQTIIGAITAYLSFELFRLCGFNLYASANAQSSSIIQPHWRNLYLVGLFSSMLNGLLSSVIFYPHIEAGNLVPFILMYIAGDMVGTLAVFVAILAAMRLVKPASS